MTIFSTTNIPGIIMDLVDNTPINNTYVPARYYESPIVHQEDNLDSEDSESSEDSDNNSIKSAAINKKFTGCTPVNLQYDKSLSFRPEETMNSAQTSITIIDSAASRS